MQHAVGWSERAIRGEIKLPIMTPIMRGQQIEISGEPQLPLDVFRPMVTVCMIWWAMFGNGALMRTMRSSMPIVQESIPS